MAVVAPFRGILFNQDKVGELDGVVAPPYDVISPEDRQWYLGRHPNNIVRLILPHESAEMDKHQRSASTMRGWLDSGVLVQDEHPTFYVCEQEYELDGEWKRRLGLTCLVRLEDYGQGVMPHEKILTSPLEDRLNLMRATKANFDSVFGLYPGGAVEAIVSRYTAHPADASAVDRRGVKCHLWRISDPDAADEIVRAMAPERILIADGHHRYAAALAYRDEMRAEATSTDPNAPWEFVLMTLVSLENKGLVVLPTHRLVRNIEGLDPDAFLALLGKYFKIASVPRAELVAKLKSLNTMHHVFGLYLDGGKSFLIALKPDVKPEEAIDSPGPDELKKLDVSILHSLVLEKLLGIGAQELTTQSNLRYSQDADLLMHTVDQGEAQMAFLMNATRIADVIAVASTGERMPQKSTYFYPKLLTGMVLRLVGSRQ